ncbi:hypothetical protein EYF80_009435 [Liparis tanakae]|uniref:Uncharacterized protein n=1 Tax=Liparis tanakae TaxID=230148 RepID=A0A4Z2IRE9_9TELE|nr:hypothetical protein EYF80_009435 [Liparis tanakae]
MHSICINTGCKGPNTTTGTRATPVLQITLKPSPTQSQLLPLLRPRVEQHRPPSQPGLHPSLRNHVLGPVAGPLRVHRPQLLVAPSYAVQTPQLVAQALALLRQDENLSDRRAAHGTRRAAVSGEVEPGQRGVGLGVLSAHGPLVHSEEHTWNHTDRRLDNSSHVETQLWLSQGRRLEEVVDLEEVEEEEEVTGGTLRTSRLTSF